jgi:Skp family chaperone for outer membrane proteins
MKKIALFISLLLIFGIFFFGFRDKFRVGLVETNVGVLDVNRVLASLSQIKDVQAELKKKFDPRGQELVNLQNAFRDNLDKYRQNNSSFQGEMLKKEQQKIIDENKKLQEMRVRLQQDLIAAQNHAVVPILQQVDNVVNKIAKDQNFATIINKASTVYNNSQFEITDRVITEMRKLPVAKPATQLMKSEEPKNIPKTE